MLDKIITWLGEYIPKLFATYGWQASLAVICTVTLLALIVLMMMRRSEDDEE